MWSVHEQRLYNKQQFMLYNVLLSEEERQCAVTLAFGARWAIRAAAALLALFSSIKLMVELIMSRRKIPIKSWYSMPNFCMKNVG
jgi:hypothetical protein